MSQRSLTARHDLSMNQLLISGGEALKVHGGEI
jgi:hypothetical protein